MDEKQKQGQDQEGSDRTGNQSNAQLMRIAQSRRLIGQRIDARTMSGRCRAVCRHAQTIDEMVLSSTIHSKVVCFSIVQPLLVQLHQFIQMRCIGRQRKLRVNVAGQQSGIRTRAFRCVRRNGNGILLNAVDILTDRFGLVHLGSVGHLVVLLLFGRVKQAKGVVVQL